MVPRISIIIFPDDGSLLNPEEQFAVGVISPRVPRIAFTKFSLTTHSIRLGQDSGSILPTFFPQSVIFDSQGREVTPFSVGQKSIHLSLIPSMFFRISLLEPDPMIFFPFAETDFTIVDFLHHLPGSEFFYDFAFGIESGDVPRIAIPPITHVHIAVGMVF